MFTLTHGVFNKVEKMCKNNFFCYVSAKALPMSVLSNPVLKQNIPTSTIQSSNMIIYNNQPSVSSLISGGRLIIPNKKNIINRQPNSAVLKPGGSPILNHVRYIGQPNGKMQKVVYLPANISASSSPLVTKPILDKTIAQLTSLQQQSIISHGGKLNTPPRVIGPVHNLAVKNAVPILLNAQGIPLKVGNPSSLSATSLTIPTHILPTQMKGATSSATISTPPTSQHLQGLKKAVEQVAAVTQINAKLQNHLQKKDIPMQPGSCESQIIRNNPLTPSKVFIKTENSNEKIPFAFKLSADQVALSRTLGVSGNNRIVVSKQNLQPVAIPYSNVQPIQPKKGTKTFDTNQSGISFILTKNGLVSVSLPSQIQNKVKVNTVPSTQNIITSKMPAHILTSRPTLSVAPGMMTSPKVSIIKIPTQSHAVSMNRMSVQQHVLSNAVLSPVINTSTIIPSISSSTAQIPSVSSAPTTISTNVTTSVFINKMPTNILLSRPTPLTTHATLTATQAPVSISTPKPQDPKDTKKESPPNSSMFRAANNVTPEKLRDAEALLGLINPMHHSPKKQNTSSSSEIVSPRSLLASVVPKTEPSSSSISLPTDSPIKQQMFRHSTVQENNHLKINLPNSQSSSLAPPLKIPKMMLSPDKVKSSTVPLISTKVVTGGHKMVVNASQLKKLHEEGKVVVTPSGQMFLMTGAKPVQQPATPTAATNNGKP